MEAIRAAKRRKEYEESISEARYQQQLNDYREAMGEYE